jgi:uncharacterized membrane protein (Fun14 family)
MVIDSTLISDVTPIAIGGLTGYGIGWLCKKVFKIAIIGIGLVLALLAYLENQKTITVNWNVANNQTSVILHTISSKILEVANNVGTDLNSHASAFPVLGVVGFIPGFLAGIMRG